MSDFLAMMAVVAAGVWWFSGDALARLLMFAGLAYLWIPDAVRMPHALAVTVAGLAVAWAVSGFPAWVWRQPPCPRPTARHTV